MSHIELKHKEDCCGCGACAASCPVNAIVMKADEAGFMFPNVDPLICLNCGRCIKACAFHDAPKARPMEVYAATNASLQDCLLSSSGGIFPAAARLILNKGGVVFGASLEFLDGHRLLKHCAASTEMELSKLRGSKYAQSDLTGCFQQVKKQLDSGKKVLFSGTPCQISALKRYVGKGNDNLYTIDIICHGVPNQKIFYSYLDTLSKRIQCSIEQFSFRDKHNSWGHCIGINYRDVNGKRKHRVIASQLSSYYYLFLKGLLSRESCHQCPFAGKERVGDLTLGDYWGVEKEHPEYLKENGGKFNQKYGVSVVLINSSKGQQLFYEIAPSILYEKSEFECAAKHNQNLNKVHPIDSRYKEIQKAFVQNGYEGVERCYRQIIGISYYILKIKTMIPYSFKGKIKWLIGRR